MAALSFQKPTLAAVQKHIRLKQSIKWAGMDIHPPVVVNASVSSGKSVMIAELAKSMIDSGVTKGNRVKVLVIQVQGELADQNSQAAWDIGLDNSVYSASLNAKSTYYDVVYTTIGTLARALDKEFGDDGFLPDLIAIDENHQVPFEELESQYMTSLIHFYKKKKHLRVVGFSGSPFRASETIIADYWHSFAKIERHDPFYPEGGVGDGQISTEFMLDQGWVTPPQFGWPDHEEDAYDFSGLETRSGSWEFSEAELDERTSDFKKLLAIMAEVVERSKDRMGVLIFAATQRHTGQVAKALSMLGVADSDIGVIIDSTGDKERSDILGRAKEMKCKFTINVGVLTTGVNVPAWDTLVFLRPIGSLVLLIQAIGRVLRLLFGEGTPGMVERDSLSAEERHALIAASDKPFSLILDYAGVMDRLGHMYENPILERAEKEHAKQKNEMIDCPDCGEQNSIHARRCIGVSHGARCEHFWQSRLCPGCGCKNDIVARECRNCHQLLIDPNASLTGKHYTDSDMQSVKSMKLTSGSGGKLIVQYEMENGDKPVEFYYPNAGNNRQVNTRVYFNNFVKVHVPSPGYQMRCRNFTADKAVELSGAFGVPTAMAYRWNPEKNKFTIGRKLFKSQLQGVSCDVSATDEVEATA